MKNFVIFAALLCLFPLAMPAADAAAKDGLPSAEQWGKSLPSTVSFSFWSTKEGEAKAFKVTTSREAFAYSLEIGKKDKEGMKIGVGGRILSRPDGSFEVLLGLEVAGMSDKGGLGLKMQCSAIAKKGVAVSIATYEGGSLMMRLD